MAAKQSRLQVDPPIQALFDKLEIGAEEATAAELAIFAYSVKVVCGRQTEAHCCCTAGARPGVYATEVNIQNISLKRAPVVKAVLPLINMGAVVGREPGFADPAKAKVDSIILPPLAATMDDCCRIAELQLGAPSSGETPLTIAILTILSTVELTVSAVYTATPLVGDGISIDVEYILPRRLALGDRG